MFRNKAALLKAASQLGVKELDGVGSNEQIEEYHAYSTKDNMKTSREDVPWCASFVCWVLEKVGMGSTNSKMARSYEGWGVEDEKANLPGDIVVFWRKSKASGFGHVAFLLKETPNYVYCLGGNQNDEVNVTRYSKSRITTIRRSSKAGEYTEEQVLELYSIAEKILNDEPVEEAGSVV